MVKYIAIAWERWIANWQIIDGKKVFRPNDPITRAEALAILLKAANIQVNWTNYGTCYSDIKDDAYNMQEIMLATEKKIMNGYSDHTFQPDTPLSYGAAAKAIVNAFDIKKYVYGKEVLIDNFREHYLETLINAGIIDNMPDDIDANIPKKEAATMLYRIIKLRMEK